MQIEHAFTCPHCFQRISVLLDPGAGEASLVEDCEVCCRPIQIRYEIDGDRVVSFTADPAD
jgi:transcription elongation factor Elf1